MSPAVPGDRRSEILSGGLADLGCEALLILAESSREPDLAPFVGPVHLGPCFLLAVPRRPALLGYLSPMEREEAAASGLDLLDPERLDVAGAGRASAAEEEVLATVVATALGEAGLAPASADEPRRLALAGGGRAGVVAGFGRALGGRGWTTVPGTHLARMLRKPKSGREVVAARRSAAGAATALRRVAELLAAAEPAADGELWLGGERLRVARLKVAAAEVFAAFELEQPHGNLIAPGEEGAVPHNAGSPERVLRAGESLIVDLYPRGWLFADCTRTLCVGDPPPALAAAHQLLVGELDRVKGRLHRRAVDAGLRAWSLQDSVCARLRQAGYPEPISDPTTTRGYVHNLGHGVGFEIHEYPSFRRDAGEEALLAEGDLLTLEPGLYEPEEGWAVRLEDLMYLGAEGPENLTPLPYDLDPRAYR